MCFVPLVANGLVALYTHPQDFTIDGEIKEDEDYREQLIFIEGKQGDQHPCRGNAQVEARLTTVVLSIITIVQVTIGSSTCR